MKMFDWLNPRKKNQSEIHATEIHQQQNRNGSPVELHAAVPARSLMKLSDGGGAGLGFDSFEFEEQPRKRREIVKIFVNHEEYGLLAIGTLGLYKLTEIELFEVKPNTLQPDQFQKQELKQQQKPPAEEHEKNNNEKKKKNQSKSGDEDQEGGVLCKDSRATTKKKLFSLDPHLRSMLHPLNNFRRNTTPSTGPLEIQSNKEKPKKASSVLKKLFMGKGQSMSMKQITNPTNPTSSSEEKPTSKPGIIRCQSKWRRAMSQFSCMSIQADQSSDDDSDDEDESPDDDSKRRSAADTGALSTPDAKSSARGDPNAGHQQTCVKDMRPEYWIRTDSDFVVLEL